MEGLAGVRGARYHGVGLAPAIDAADQVVVTKRREAESRDRRGGGGVPELQGVGDPVREEKERRREED